MALLFAALADISNEWDIPYIQDGQGLPLDAAEETMEAVEFWDPQGHSHSYVYPEELRSYFDLHQNSENEALRMAATNIIVLYYSVMDVAFNITNDSLTKRLEISDMRLVFWFDS